MRATSREILAAEAQYHHSCYRDYTRDYDKYDKEKKDTLPAKYKDEYEEAVEHSIAKMYDYIRQEVIGKGVCKSMTNICNVLKTSMIKFRVESTTSLIIKCGIHDR